MFSPFSSLGPLLAEKQREVVPCFPLFPFPLQFLLYPNCYRRERREEAGKFLIDQCFCPPTSALRCLNLTLSLLLQMLWRPSSLLCGFLTYSSFAKSQCSSIPSGLLLLLCLPNWHQPQLPSAEDASSSCGPS